MSKLMSEKQKALIDDMNELCRNKLFYDDKTTAAEASEYISNNIEDFKLQQLTNWDIQYM